MCSGFNNLLIYIVYASVITDYEGKKPSELTLKVGDKIKVTKQGPRNWIGTSHGKVGSFPPSCVKVEDAPPAARKISIVSNRPSSSYTPSSAAPQKPATAVKRSVSNYSTSSIIPPPLDNSSTASKAVPLNIPPPPSSLIPASPNTARKNRQLAASQPLPKFSESKDKTDNTPFIPPRSPPREITKSDLPNVPPHPNVTPSTTTTATTEETPATPEPRKRTKDELRKECITEIYQTEKDYIDDLETMINVN